MRGSGKPWKGFFIAVRRLDALFASGFEANRRVAALQLAQHSCNLTKYDHPMASKSSSKSTETAKVQLPLLSDSAIGGMGFDAFGLEKTLGSVVDAILLKETETPFAVMFSGGWGKGKTSAMKWLDGTLESRSKENDGLKVDTCWFYPWKYQNQEDVWRGLIAEVILRAIRVEGVDAAKVVKAARQFGAFLGRGFVRILSSIKVSGGEGVSGELDLKEALGGVIEEYGKHITPQEAYYNEFEDVLKRWVEDTYPSGKDRRLVVFIDDLDRCMPNIALQVLEALKLYLNIPNLIFIVGVDRHVIDHIVQKRYAELVGDDAMKDGFAKKAAQYLDKMFPVEVDVEPSDEAVEAFFKERVEGSAIWLEVPEKHRETFRRVILDLGDKNPRSIVRLVNRVVVACGKQSDQLSVEQRLQRELLEVICRSEGYESSPEKSSVGRQFFAKWSEIICAGNGKATYLPQSEIDSQPGGSNPKSARWIDNLDQMTQLAEGTKPKRGEFDHLFPLLAEEFSTFRRLLPNLQIARLLGIPYRSLSSEDGPGKDTIASGGVSREEWEDFRQLVAKSMGRDPEDLKDDELENIQDLDLSTAKERISLAPCCRLKDLRSLVVGFEVESIDLSPLAGHRNLKYLGILNGKNLDVSALAELSSLIKLRVWHSRISDLSPLSRLRNLVSLDLTDGEVIDLSPLSNLVNLSDLAVSLNPVASLDPLSGLNQLSYLNLAGTGVKDLRPLMKLPKLVHVTLPSGSVWDGKSERYP